MDDSIEADVLVTKYVYILECDNVNAGVIVKRALANNSALLRLKPVSGIIEGDLMNENSNRRNREE